MEIKKIINMLESLIKNPRGGLPEDVFLFLTRITPIINVDLLIKNENNQTLLTWRDDGYWKPGWHIPGGIIRYKENIANRVNAVAAKELEAQITFKEKPLAINEFIHPTRSNRGHFISLLYECELAGKLDENRRYEKGVPKPGEWAWHSKCPENMISIHDEMYRVFI